MCERCGMAFDGAGGMTAQAESTVRRLTQGRRRLFRVKVSLYNDRLVRAREAMGFRSAKAFADAHHQLHYYDVSSYEAFRISPICSTGWRVSAKNLAEALGELPEDFWPKEAHTLNAALLTAWCGEVLTSTINEETVDIPGVLERALDRLSPRTRKMLRWRFGLDPFPKLSGPCYGLREEVALNAIGREMGVTTSRAGQIITRGLQKLRQDPAFREIDGWDPR